ncbi:MAG: hypothetical protein M1450_01575 [Patescibacteria group bacterium]|nr:hypothetical protein [Patescibacteria group bacterium]
MLTLRNATLAVIGIIGLASAIVCALLWVELDSNLTSAYFKVRQADTIEAMNQALDKMDGASDKVYELWAKVPGVQTKPLYDVKMMARYAQARISSGDYVFQVKGDLMAEYNSKDLMPWSPYAYVIMACLALTILVLAWPQKKQKSLEQCIYEAIVRGPN